MDVQRNKGTLSYSLLVQSDGQGEIGDLPAKRYFPAGTSELTEPPGEAQTEEGPSGHQGGTYCSSAPVCFQVVGTVLSSFLLLSDRTGLKDMIA